MRRVGVAEFIATGVDFDLRKEQLRPLPSVEDWGVWGFVRLASGQWPEWGNNGPSLAASPMTP
jgi:hypothetical protein